MNLFINKIDFTTLCTLYIEKDSKHERAKASKRLREDMMKGNVQSERRIYIEFPSQMDHAHHLTGEVR